MQYDSLHETSQKIVDRHVKSFMTALGLYAATATTGIQANRDAFRRTEGEVRNAVREAFATPTVLDALTKYDELIAQTQMDQTIVQARGRTP